MHDKSKADDPMQRTGRWASCISMPIVILATTISVPSFITALRFGGDVVEVAPPFDPTGNTALVGATMMFEILCVVAEAVTKT